MNEGEIRKDVEESVSPNVVVPVTADVEVAGAEAVPESDTSPTLGRLRTRKCVSHPVIHRLAKPDRIRSIHFWLYICDLKEWKTRGGRKVKRVHRFLRNLPVVSFLSFLECPSIMKLAPHHIDARIAN